MGEGLVESGVNEGKDDNLPIRGEPGADPGADLAPFPGNLGRIRPALGPDGPGAPDKISVSRALLRERESPDSTFIID